MNNRFVVKPELCIGCRTCELACSFAHAKDGKHGRTRIVVLGGGHKDLYIPVTCLQCEDPACAKSCLVNAITRNQETGAMELNHEKCVRCMACIAACPFGCSLLDEPHNLVVKCDLCGGDPACAKFCPTRALEYKPLAESSLRAAV